MEMDGDEHSHQMSMYFHTRIKEHVLFEGWHITTPGGMVGSCFAVFGIALMFEAIKALRSHLLRKEAIRQTQLSPAVSRNGDNIALRGNGEGKVRVVTPRSSILKPSHLVQTVLNVLQFLVGYALMLIFMTYNAWLCIAVTLGIGFGYFFFAWSHEEDVPVEMAVGDCCH